MYIPHGSSVFPSGTFPHGVGGRGPIQMEATVPIEVNLGDGRYMRETRRLVLRQVGRGNIVFGT